jgi:hypothetical protein
MTPGAWQWLPAGLVTFLVLSAPALPQQQRHTIIGVGGTCAALQVGTTKYSCRGMLYMRFADSGRAAYMLGEGKDVVGVSGEEDAESQSDHYVLYVDTVRLRDMQQHRASGTCDMMLNPSGPVIKSVTCDIGSDIGNVTVDFRGDGKPADTARGGSR